jgi:formyltetrahydrofolate deformylase
MLVDLRDLNIDLSSLVTSLIDLGKHIGMQVRVALHDERKRRKLMILCSKEPHCLQELLEETRTNRIRAEVVGVLANHADLKDLAISYGAHFDHSPHSDLTAHFDWLRAELKRLAPDVIALARYMRILPADIVEQYRNRIINIHPSLLPYFPGAAPYKQAYDSGVRVSGCTAHFVTEQLDEGPVILQDVFHIDVGADSSSKPAPFVRPFECSWMRNWWWWRETLSLSPG